MNKIWVIVFAFFAFLKVHAEDVVWNMTTDTIPTFNGATYNASNPLIGMDAAGDIVIAWIESNGVNSILYGNTMPFGTTYDLTRTVQLSGAFPVTEAVIVVDPVGNATVVWVENDTIFTTTYNSSFYSGFMSGMWSAATTLDMTGVSQVQVTRDFTLGNDSSVAAVWIKSTDVVSRYKPFAVDAMENGTWDPADTVAGTAAAAPQIALGNGNQTIIWYDVISSIETVFAATKAIGGFFGTTTQLSDMNIRSKDPQLTIFPNTINGFAVATWFRFEETADEFSNVFVQIAPQMDSTTWTPAEDVTQFPGMIDPNDLFLRMAANNNQNCNVVWTMSYDGSVFAIQSLYTTLANSTLIDIVRQNAFAFTVDLSIDSQSNLVTAYTYNENPTGMVVRSVDSDLASVEPGWGYPTTLSTGGADGFARVANSFDGLNTSNAAALWIHNNMTNNDLQLKKGNAILLDPPSSLMVSQMDVNYGVYVDHVNTLTWTASTSPNLIKYVIFRDDLFVNQVAADGTLQFVDHNQPNAIPPGPTGPQVKYGVAVIDDESSQSSITSVNFLP